MRAPVRAGSPGTRACVCAYVYSNEPINCFNCRRKGPAGRKLNARSAKFDYPPASASSALSCNSIWKVQISDWERECERTHTIRDPYLVGAKKRRRQEVRKMCLNSFSLVGQMNRRARLFAAGARGELKFVAWLVPYGRASQRANSMGK